MFGWDSWCVSRDGRPLGGAVTAAGRGWGRGRVKPRLWAVTEHHPAVLHLPNAKPWAAEQIFGAE